MKKAILYGEKDSAVLQISELLQNFGINTKIIEKTSNITLGATIRNSDYDILFAENPQLVEKEYQEILHNLIYEGDTIVFLFTDKNTINNPLTTKFLNLIGCSYAGEVKGKLSSVFKISESSNKGLNLLSDFNTEQSHKVHGFHTTNPSFGLIALNENTKHSTMTMAHIGLGMAFIIGYDNLLRSKGFSFFDLKKQQKSKEAEEARSYIVETILKIIEEHSSFITEIVKSEAVNYKNNTLEEWIRFNETRFSSNIDYNFFKLQLALEEIDKGNFDASLKIINTVQMLPYFENEYYFYLKLFVEGATKIASNELRKRKRDFSNGYKILTALRSPKLTPNQFLKNFTTNQINGYIIKYIETMSPIRAYSEINNILNSVTNFDKQDVLNILKSKVTNLSNNMSASSYSKIITDFEATLQLTESDKFNIFKILAKKDPEFVINKIATLVNQNPRAKKTYSPIMIEAAKSMELIDSAISLKIYTNYLSFLQFSERTEIMKRMQQIRSAPYKKDTISVTQTKIFFEDYIQTDFDENGNFIVRIDLKNTSGMVLTNVKIELDSLEDRFDVISNSTIISQMKPEETQLIIFKLMPRIIGEFSISAFVTFSDAFNTKLLYHLQKTSVVIDEPTLNIGSSSPRSLYEIKEQIKILGHLSREILIPKEESSLNLLNNLNDYFLLSNFKQYLFDPEKLLGWYYSSIPNKATSEEIPLILAIKSKNEESILIEGWTHTDFVEKLIGLLLNLEKKFTIKKEIMEQLTCTACDAPVNFELIKEGGEYTCEYCHATSIFSLQK